jgi:hypothetical protein
MVGRHRRLDQRQRRQPTAMLLLDSVLEVRQATVLDLRLRRLL